MKIKQIFAIVLVFAMLSTTSAVFAAEDLNWNDKSFTVPDDFTVGTPGAHKIGMIHSKESIILEEYNSERFDELMEESSPADNKTYNIGDTEVNELLFEEDSGNVHFLTFTKDDVNYDLVYKGITISEDDEEDEEEDDSGDDSEDDADESDDGAEDSEDEEVSEEDAKVAEDEANFDATNSDNPVNIIISSLKLNS